MKKSYLEPETTIVKMRHTLLMQSRGVRSVDTGDVGITLGEQGSSGDARSRGIWDRWDD